MRLILFCTIILIHFACNNDKEATSLKIFNETIEASTKFIEQKNWETYDSFDEKLEDPKTRDKTEIWNPHARAIKYLSDSIFNYIRLIKEKAKKDYTKDASVYLNELYNRLLSYQSSLLNINTELTTTFKNLSFVSNFNADTIQLTYNNFENVLLSAPTKEAYLGLFNVLENKVRRIENRMITFCLKKIGSFITYYDKYTYLINLDKGVVASGDIIEVSAGLVEINTTTKSNVTIFEKKVESNENGIAVYKFKAAKAKGKHTVPVSIDFIDPSTGEPKTISKTITYTVR